MREPTGGKLLTLEAGRFFAAALIVLFHYTAVVEVFSGVAVLDDIFGAGHIGVPYFFVLSGFIIYHIHRNDIGRPETFGRFALKRAIRLYPIFWIISAAMLAGFLVLPSLAGERSLAPLGLASDLLLLPRSDAVLSISWTLRHEMVFYALFSLSFWFGARAFWAIAVWIGVSLVGTVFITEKTALGSWSLIASPLNLGFGLGMVAAWLLHRKPIARPLVLAAIGGGALAAYAVMDWIAGGDQPYSVFLGATGTILVLVAASVLIHGLVRVEETWRMPAARLWKVLGGSSYALYLLHQPLASVALRVSGVFRRIPPEATFVILTLIAIMVAVLVHVTIEKFLMARLSAFFFRTRPPHSPLNQA